jgi:hypothetical protein
MSDQDNGQVSTPQRPTTNDPGAWKAYWKIQGQRWRTEPEIDAERQRYLAGRHAIVPDTEKGLYPSPRDFLAGKIPACKEPI